MKWFKRNKSKQKLVGVEVRPDGLAMAVSSIRDSSPVITHAEFLEVKPARRRESLEKWVSSNKLQDMPCNIVIPSEQISLLQIEKPAVEEEELDEAVKWRVKDMIEFALEDAVVDAFPFPEDALRGKTSQVNVVVARRAVISELVDLAKDSGLELQSIDITELVLRNIACIYAEEGNALAMLVMRGNSGSIVIIKDDVLYLSRRIDADLEGLSDPERADRISEQITLEIQRSFDYFESQMAQRPPQRIMVFSTTEAEKLRDVLDKNLAVTAAVLDLAALSEGEDVVEDSSRLVLAIGAAMRQEAS